MGAGLQPDYRLDNRCWRRAGTRVAWVNRDNGSTVNAEGFYAFATGVADSDDSKALWNFEFSIDATSPALSTYNFYLGIDVDPTTGVDYQSYLVDPLTYSFVVNNSVGNQDGHDTFQNSLNIASFLPFQYGNQEGTFDFRLFAVEKEMGNSPDPSLGGFNWTATNLPLVPVADVNIQVIVSAGAPVPDVGSTLAMLSLSLAGLVGINRRKRA